MDYNILYMNAFLFSSFVLFEQWLLCFDAKDKDLRRQVDGFVSEWFFFVLSRNREISDDEIKGLCLVKIMYDGKRVL